MGATDARPLSSGTPGGRARLLTGAEFLRDELGLEPSKAPRSSNGRFSATRICSTSTVAPAHSPAEPPTARRGLSGPRRASPRPGARGADADLLAHRGSWRGRRRRSCRGQRRPQRRQVDTHGLSQHGRADRSEDERDRGDVPVGRLGRYCRDRGAPLGRERARRHGVATRATHATATIGRIRPSASSRSTNAGTHARRAGTRRSCGRSIRSRQDHEGFWRAVARNRRRRRRRLVAGRRSAR